MEGAFHFGSAFRKTAVFGSVQLSEFAVRFNSVWFSSVTEFVHLGLADLLTSD